MRCRAFARGRGQDILVFVLFLSVWPLYGTPASSADGKSERSAKIEYGIKAAFLYNFAKFTDWPDDALAETNGTFTVCILGQSPFGEALDTISDKMVHGRPIQINFCSSIEDVKACQVLFICNSEKPHLQSHLVAVRDRGMLTVSEIEGFVGRGGVICFVNEGEKVRFKINQAASKNAGLKINSRLLALAQDVVEDVPMGDF